MGGETKPTAKPKGGGFSARGWLIVLYVCLTAYIGLAVTNSFLNLSTDIFAQQYGWDSLTLLSQNSIFGWLTIILIMVIGQFLVKTSPRIMAIIVGAIYTVNCFLVPYIAQMWQYTVAMGVINVLNTLWMIQINAVIITNWFPHKQGTVMGIMSFAMALGTGTGVALFSALLDSMGHAGVWTVFGIVNAVCILMLIFLVKDYPEQCGEFPDNDRSMTREQALAEQKAGMEMAKNSVWTVKNLLATPQTWMIGIALGTLPLFTAGYTSQMIPHFLSLGLDRMAAVGMTSIMSLCACIGALICGALAQKLGARKGMLICTACVVIACILNAIPNIVTVSIALAFVGMCLGGASTFLVSTIGEYWGRFGFAGAQRVVMPIQQCVGAAGTIVMAACATAVSYEFAFIVLGVAAAIGFALIFAVKSDSIAKRQAQLEAAAGKTPASQAPKA